MAKAPVKKAAAAKKAPAKKPAAEKKVPAKSAEKAPTTDGGSGGVKIVSNKVCQAFKTRAEGLKKAILAANPQASVEIEEQKPLGETLTRELLPFPSWARCWWRRWQCLGLSRQ